MKAEITRDGYIKVIAENYAEAFTLNYLSSRLSSESCGHCGKRNVDIPVIFDGSILNCDLGDK